MCLAVPMRIVEIQNGLAWVEVAGVRRQVSVELLEDPKVGEFVMVHAGYAIERVSEEEAQETLDLIRQVASLGEEGEPPMQEGLGGPRPEGKVNT